MSDNTELAPGNEPEDTTAIPDIKSTRAAPALAWSEDADADAVADTTILDTEDDDGWDDYDRAYAWGTVKIFAGCMAFTIIGIAFLAWLWVTHPAPEITAESAVKAGFTGFALLLLGFIAWAWITSPKAGGKERDDD